MGKSCTRSRRTGELLHVALSTFIAGSLLAPSLAVADTTDELLDLLRAKGALTREEYQKLKARHEGEVKKREEKVRAAAAPPPASGPPSGDMVTKAVVPPPQYVTALPKGVGLRIGDVDVTFTGDISFFGIEDFPARTGARVDGGLIAPHATDSNAISGGLLPSEIGLGITTTQNGIDLGAHFGIYTGGVNIEPNAANANGPGSPIGLGTAGVDFRQAYGTLGTPTFGTVKIGRDIGIFAADAILNDLTLFGVGTPSTNFAPKNTTLGRIGLGYVYPDWIPQITYTTPNFYGFTVSGGLFTPYDEFDFSGDSASMTGQNEPGFQAGLKWVGTLMPSVKLTAWTDALEQKHIVADAADQASFTVPIPVGYSVRSWGVDAGARLDVGPASLVAYGYGGNGLGTTALFWDAVSPTGQTRDSHGGYIQGSYTFFDLLMVGGSWGISTLDAAPGDVTFLVHSQQSAIGFVRYKLTDWVNLQAEYVHTWINNQAGGSVLDNTVVAGTTFFW
jgi:predicted porin